MDWKTPYIVYRLNAEKCMEEVFWTSDIKKAKYWLTYIAKPGDVLCKTPAHPKHSHQSKTPEYWSHKESSGKPCTNEHAWKNIIKKQTEADPQLPNEQFFLPAD
jgi:hypothetical protein